MSDSPEDDAIRLPAHPLEDEQFEQQLRTEVEAARARIRAAPSPLAGLTREDILRARACALPELIGVMPRGTGQG